MSDETDSKTPKVGEPDRDGHWNVQPLERFTVNYSRTPPTGSKPSTDYASRKRRDRLKDALLRRHPA
jgi:hypothetical protein